MTRQSTYKPRLDAPRPNRAGTSPLLCALGAFALAASLSPAARAQMVIGSDGSGVELATQGLAAEPPAAPETPELVDRTRLHDGLEITAAIAGPAPIPEEDTPLQLAVVINDRDTGLIAEFVHQAETGHIAATASELRELGIRPPQAALGWVDLEQIENLSYTYDPASQLLIVNAAYSALLPEVQSAAGRGGFTSPDASWGAVLNYGINTQFGPNSEGGWGYSYMQTALSGWIYAPFGALSTTGFYRAYGHDDAENGFVRQETTLELNNLRHAATVALGDVTSSATTWSRPLRMGGVQIRRDFSLRSDIVTEQLLSFGGAAAVPSTVDVFIENNRTWSGRVNEGPFQIEDIPVVSGDGAAVVVVTDASGRQTTQEISFFTAPSLLKKGTLDFSLEAGRPREGYGSVSNQYADTMVYSGSLSYGLSKRVTLEAHAEGTEGLFLAGMGMHAAAGKFGTVSLAFGQSTLEEDSANFVYGELSTNIGRFDVQVSSLRSDAGFVDLAALTGTNYLGADVVADTGSLVEFPTITDVISLGIPIGDDARSLGLSVVRSERENSRDLIAAASYSHDIGRDGASFSVYGSHNFEDDESNFSMSFNMPLGKRVRGRASYTTDTAGDYTTTLYASRARGDAVGDFGYNARLERQNTALYGGGGAEYLGQYGKVAGELLYSGDEVYGRASLDGAVVIAGGQPAIGNTVTDSFAIVDTGAPDVPIYVQNREIARSGPGGKALVTGLSSYRSSRVSVDPMQLDPSVQLNATAADVVPTRNGGVLVDFAADLPGEGSGVGAGTALVTLVSPSGAVLPAGSEAKLSGRGPAIPVGYDGLTFVAGLAAQNELVVELIDGGRCTARFGFTPNGELQQSIGPVTCK